MPTDATVRAWADLYDRLGDRGLAELLHVRVVAEHMGVPIESVTDRSAGPPNL